MRMDEAVEETSTGEPDDDDVVHSPYYKYKVVKNTIPRRDMNINDQYRGGILIFFMPWRSMQGMHVEKEEEPEERRGMVSQVGWSRLLKPQKTTRCQPNQTFFMVTRQSTKLSQVPGRL